jgi:hypothetical protein
MTGVDLFNASRKRRTIPSSRGAKRRGDPEALDFADALDCFASLAMTVAGFPVAMTGVEFAMTISETGFTVAGTGLPGRFLNSSANGLPVNSSASGFPAGFQPVHVLDIFMLVSAAHRFPLSPGYLARRHWGIWPEKVASRREGVNVYANGGSGGREGIVGTEAPAIALSGLKPLPQGAKGELWDRL